VGDRRNSGKKKESFEFERESLLGRGEGIVLPREKVYYRPSSPREKTSRGRSIGKKGARRKTELGGGKKKRKLSLG